jgi:hypothetical protein
MATSQTSPTTRAKRVAARARRKPRTAAAKPRTTAAKASTKTTSTRSASRAARAQQLAERVVLIPVGVALEARNRVAGTVGELVTTTRTQLERQTRSARRGFDRQRAQALKTLDFDVAGLPGRVENVVQNGAQTGRKLVNGAQDRIAKVV